MTQIEPWKAAQLQQIQIVAGIEGQLGRPPNRTAFCQCVLPEFDRKPSRFSYKKVGEPDEGLAPQQKRKPILRSAEFHTDVPEMLSLLLSGCHTTRRVVPWSLARFVTRTYDTLTSALVNICGHAHSCPNLPT